MRPHHTQHNKQPRVQPGRFHGARAFASPLVIARKEASSPSTPEDENSNVVGEVQERVTHKLRRPVVAGDIVYTYEYHCLSSSGASGGSFVARLDVTAVPGCPTCIGLPAMNKREAKRSVCEVALANQTFKTLLPPTPQQDGRKRPAEAQKVGLINGPVLTPGLQPSANATAAPPSPQAAASAVPAAVSLLPEKMRKPDPVVNLHERVQKATRHMGMARILRYTCVQVELGAFSATLELESPEDRIVHKGPLRANKREAKRAVAEIAVADPRLPDFLKRLEPSLPLVVPGEFGTNPVGELQERMMAYTRRPVSKGDIVYSMHQEVDGLFVCTIEVNTPTRIVQRGTPCPSKRETKSAAALALLRDPHFQAALPAKKSVLTEPKAPRAQREPLPPGAKLPGMQAPPMALTPGPCPPRTPSVPGSLGQPSGQQPEKVLGGPVARNLLTPNPVSELQERVQRVTRRLSTKEDIVYTFEVRPGGTFVACVQIGPMANLPPVTGTAAPNKRLAKKSAAEEALAKLQESLNARST